MRRLLWRRGLVLVIVGFLHAVLLYAGDILGAYGVLLFVGAWLVHWKDRWLLLTALVFFVLAFLPNGDSSTISSAPPDVSMLPPDVGTMVVERARTSLYVALLGPLGFVCPFVLGLWAGRRRILEQPERHRTSLRVTASVGIGAAVLGAQPISLMLAGVVTRPNQPTLELIGPLHDATGILGGLGYAALLSLVAVRLQARRRPAVDAIAAAGQRSMTCYLAQSVVWTLAFTPFLLDLSATLTVATTALLATVTWMAVTWILADRMRRAGHRGPFELLVRRATYGRTSQAAASRPPEPTPGPPPPPQHTKHTRPDSAT